ASYAFTQPLGRYLRDQGTNGLLVRSARDLRPKGGVNAALFRPEPLSRVRDLCHLTYLMNPAKDVARVERTPGRLWRALRPTRLAWPEFRHDRGGLRPDSSPGTAASAPNLAPSPKTREVAMLKKTGLLLKAGLIAMLFLVLQIPLGMIDGLVKERDGR